MFQTTGFSRLWARLVVVRSAVPTGGAVRRLSVVPLLRHRCGKAIDAFSFGMFRPFFGSQMIRAAGRCGGNASRELVCSGKSSSENRSCGWGSEGVMSLVRGNMSGGSFRGKRLFRCRLSTVYRIDRLLVISQQRTARQTIGKKNDKRHRVYC